MDEEEIVYVYNSALFKQLCNNYQFVLRGNLTYRDTFNNIFHSRTTHQHKMFNLLVV